MTAAKKTTPPKPKQRRLKPRGLIVAPSLLSADFADLKGEIRQCLRAKCKWIHVDVMDGSFVPNITIGPPVLKALRKISKRPYYDCHLMIQNPLKHTKAFAEAGADLITLHHETLDNVRRAIRSTRALGVDVGISIKPKTPLSAIEPFLDEVDLVLIMTVEPGFGGQDLIPNTLNKVRHLSLLREEKRLGFHIEVDGGVNLQTVHLVAAAGANVFVSGSFIFQGKRVEQNVQRLLAAAAPPENGSGSQ